MIRSLLPGALILGSLMLPAHAQDDSLPPGIRAGQDAYLEFEGQRRAAAGAQIQLNELMRNRLPWSSPYGDTIYYAPPGYGSGGYSPLGYGVTMHPAYGYSPQNYLAATLAFTPGTYIPYPSLFAYDYPPPAIRQPIGMRQVQTGPRRWESHPVYADEVARPPRALVESPIAPGREKVRDAEPPPLPREPSEPKPRRGPREF